MSPLIGINLGGFHHQVVRRLTGRQLKRRLDGTWDHPPLADAMKDAGIKEVETYTIRIQNTVAKFIMTSPIMDLCLEAARIPGQGLVGWLILLPPRVCWDIMGCE